MEIGGSLTGNGADVGNFGENGITYLFVYILVASSI